MIEALTFALALASAPTIGTFDGGRVKVSAKISNSKSARAHASAQLKLIRLAKKACKGKGKPVSEGTLYLDNLEPKGKSKPALVVSEFYNCIPD